jgi:hypothetical protein
MPHNGDFYPHMTGTMIFWMWFFGIITWLALMFYLVLGSVIFYSLVLKLIFT